MLEPDVAHHELSIRVFVQALSFDLVVTSPEVKARETAKRLFGEDQSVEVDERFAELQRGRFLKDYETQVTATFNAPELSINGWESADSCQQRGREALRILAQKKLDRICVCGHGLQGALLRSFSLKQAHASLKEWAAINMPDHMWPAPQG